jgi:hypothetical protein
MSVTPISNQPIRFQNIDQIDVSCDCIGQDFCQLIQSNDPTQFQLSSTNTLTNGDFESNLDGWTIYEAIEVEATIINESEDGLCDGEIEVSASGGVPGYTYSLDGGAFGATVIFSDLCSGIYIITVKDSEGNEGSISVTVNINIVCGDYQGFTLQQMTDSGITLGQLYNCTLDDIQP